MAKSNYQQLEDYGNLPQELAEKSETQRMNERAVIIRKSNELIRDFRVNMTLSQFRLANYLIAIAYTQKGVEEINFDIKRYCEICGIDLKSGKNYKQIKTDIKKLSDRSMWTKVFDDPDTEVLVRLINKSWINSRSGVVRLRLDEDVKRYIMELAKQYNVNGTLYTTYTFLYTLPMKSIYSMRLYELLKSWETKKSAEDGHFWTVDHLQKILGSSYERYVDFKRKVIEKAIEEINEYTDITVSYEPIKEGRCYKYINFFIEAKPDDKIITMQSKINWYLDVLRDTERAEKAKKTAELPENAEEQTAFFGCENMPEPPEPPKKRGRPRKNAQK